MTHEIQNKIEKRKFFGERTFWLIVGFSIFAVIAFVIPTPKSLINILDKYGYAESMIQMGVAKNTYQAAWKAKLIVGIIPMAVIFFTTEALPIGLVGILMPILAYFFHLLPKATVGKTFCGDAPLFLLGVLGMGVVITEVGLHKRLGLWVLGWAKGFKKPIFALAISMACLASFISAHAIAAFMTSVIVMIYFEAVKSASGKGEVKHDPNLAKLLLFTLCFSLNVGGVGSPAAGGRNAIMMGFFSEYNVPMNFTQWMIYGFPMIPALSIVVALYLLFVFRKTKVKDLTPGLEALKKENKEMGPMKFNEIAVLAVVLLVLFLWITQSKSLGLGGPALLALLIPVILRIVKWKKLLSNIAWNAWFMYCGALTMGILLKDSGAALWLAKFFLDALTKIGAQGQMQLWVGTSLFSGVITNFMSDAATTALLGPIVLPLGIFSGGVGEPWAIGLLTAFATSFAHFFIVGTPNNAIIYALALYPGTKKNIIHPVDFLKYGLILWVLCMIVMWVICFVFTFRVIGFPPGITETAKSALEATKVNLSAP